MNKTFEIYIGNNSYRNDIQGFVLSGRCWYLCSTSGFIKYQAVSMCFLLFLVF